MAYWPKKTKQNKTKQNKHKNNKTKNKTKQKQTNRNKNNNKKPPSYDLLVKKFVGRGGALIDGSNNSPPVFIYKLIPYM